MKYLNFPKILTLIALFAFLAIMPNTANAQNPCDKDNPVCTDWSQWSPRSKWVQFPSGYRNGRHGIINCPVRVDYETRTCNTNYWITEYRIIGYYIDLDHEIYIEPYGWIRPCAAALDIFKGSSEDVSLKNNELMRNLFKQVLLKGFTDIAEQYPGFSPCNPGPKDPNRPHIGVTTNIATCQGSCITWGPRGNMWDYSEARQPDSLFIRDITKDNLPIELLAKMYNVPLTGENAIKIRPLSEEGLKEINEYIQSEINPNITEDEFKIPPIPTTDAANVAVKYHSCIADFCCVYKLTICQDENRQINLTEEYLSDVSKSDCDNTTNPVTTKNCVKGDFNFMTPCTINGCNE